MGYEKTLTFAICAQYAIQIKPVELRNLVLPLAMLKKSTGFNVQVIISTRICKHVTYCDALHKTGL